MERPNGLYESPKWSRAANMEFNTNNRSTSLLIEDLEGKIESETDAAQIDKTQNLIKRVQAGDFDMYRSLYIAPTTMLMTELYDLGYPDLADRALRGEYSRAGICFEPDASL